MPYEITQCYLPSSRADIPALTPAEARALFRDPGGMPGWVDLAGWLHTEMVYPPEELTCRMGSLGVTCYPAELVSLYPAKARTQFSDPGGMQGWADIFVWFYTEMIYPPEYGHPSQY